MFNHSIGNTGYIRFLKCIKAKIGRYGLTANNHHWSRVHVSRHNSGNCIRSTRSGSHQNHTCFTGNPGIAVSGMGCTLFMAA